MIRYGIVLIAVLAAFLSGPAEARTDGVQVVLKKGPSGETTVEGHFTVEKSSGSVWRILSSYDDLANFVSSVRVSRTIEQGDGYRLIEQVMVGRAGLFRKKVNLVLRVSESPGQILFEDTAKKSFRSYSGSWTIRPGEDRTEVVYTLTAVPAFFSPDFLADGAFKRSAQELLEELRKQILLL